MELIHSTRMVAGYSLSVDPSGRELLVVVIKGTFVLPRPGDEVRLHEEQSPLVMADTFTGEAGFSSPIYEIDYAPRKPACDVLLVGHARSPDGRPITRLRAGMGVGTVTKMFDVVGDRVWRAGLTGITPSEPQPFVEMLISYDCAFGGTDRDSEDERQHDAYRPNPVGRGWHKHVKDAWVDGTPMPNTEQPGQAIKFPNDTYTPMALGPLGRGWPQRARYAGTYDQRWLEEMFPFLPGDFDDRYYQAAPEDQQIPPPQGPTDVTLSGFTADGPRHFALPHFEAPVHVFLKRGGREDLNATLDTIVFEPDHDRFTMTWRLARPLKKSVHEIAQILVGRKGKAWWQKREQVVFPIPVVAVPMKRAASSEAQQI